MGQKLTRYFNWYSNHFFPFYLSEHQNPKGRALHYGASAAGAVGLTATLATGSLWFLAAGIGAGYLQAWAGHEKYEKNMPATFKVPLGSLMSDYVMTALWLTGRLEKTMEKHGLDPSGQNPVMKDLLPFKDYVAQQANPDHVPNMLKAQRGKTIISALKQKLSL